MVEEKERRGENTTPVMLILLYCKERNFPL